MYRIGVDIGGTFTDFALHDASGERIAIHKRLTTPADPSEAVLEGVKALVGAEPGRPSPTSSRSCTGRRSSPTP